MNAILKKHGIYYKGFVQESFGNLQRGFYCFGRPEQHCVKSEKGIFAGEENPEDRRESQVRVPLRHGLEIS